MRNGYSNYILMKKVNCACNNNKNNSDLKIYAYMARMSGNDYCPSVYFGESSQLTNWILYSGAICHMTAEVSFSIPDMLKDTDKQIEVAEVNHVMAKKG